MKRRGREESKEILGLESNEERKAERWVVGWAMKERIKECLRVILSKNLESLACTPSFWVGLYSFCLVH